MLFGIEFDFSQESDEHIRHVIRHTVESILMASNSKPTTNTQDTYKFIIIDQSKYQKWLFRSFKIENKH